MTKICRCHWVNLKNPVYIAYHDSEWGNPNLSEQEMYELFILETFQAGLSWECVLNKRGSFRVAYEGFDPKKDIEGKAVIVTRANFGCGSSREHAPWVLECNNINLVIAVNFARIFRQNMFNCGLAAIQLDEASIDDIIRIAYQGTDDKI